MCLGKHRVTLWLHTGLFVAVCLLVASPARADDEIRHIDPSTGSAMTSRGAIDQESFQGIRYRPSDRGTPVIVPATYLAEITYDVPGSYKLAYSRARTEERKIYAPGTSRADQLQAIAGAIKNYEELLALGPVSRAGFAGVDWLFRIARLRAQAAFLDPTQLRDAANSLKNFINEHRDAWQTPAALRLESRLLAEGGDLRAASEVHRQAATWRELSAEARRAQSFEAAFLSIVGRDAARGSQELASLKSLSGLTKQENLRLTVLEALAAPGVTNADQAARTFDLLESNASEPAERAMVWLMRGFEQLARKSPDEALWSFLMVDQVYPGNRAIHAEAVRQLIKLFQARGNWDKAELYRRNFWRDFPG